MAKLTIGSKTGKTYQIDFKIEILEGKKINDEFNGELILPDLKGYMLKITGGSDSSGFPMRPGLPGTGKRKILLSGGVGFKPKRKGERRRKSVRGEVISKEITQVNTIVVKEGDKKLEDIFKKEEKNGEGENTA